MLFQILPAISRMNLDKKTIKAIDARKVERTDLAGLYWRLEDEERVTQFFAQAKDVLVGAGLKPEQVKSKFGVKRAKSPMASWRRWILATMRL